MAVNSGFVDFTANNKGGNQVMRVYWEENVNLTPGALSSVNVTNVQFSTSAFTGYSYHSAFKILINGVQCVSINESDGWTVSSANTTLKDVLKNGNQLTGTPVSVAHDSNGAKTVSISIQASNWSYPGFWTSYVDPIPPSHPTVGVPMQFTNNDSKSITLTTIPITTLSVSAGTGSTVTVKRDGSTISSGTNLYYNDVINVTFGTSSSSYALATNTVKIGSTTSTGGGNYTVTGSVTITATATLRTYTLSISAGTGSTITVTRNGTTLTNGATITYGDPLVITFGTSSAAYNLGTHTVNGQDFNSGSTHSVSGAVSVVATASLKTYSLTINQGANSTITVKRGGTTLSNGATVTYGDVLVVTFSPAPGYAISTNTVKVGSTTSTGSGSYTVNGAVIVTSTAQQTTFTLHLSKGSNTTLTAKRNGTTLSDGDTLTYGDALTITFSASSGYTLTQGTVNGNDFTSGSVYTVESDVTVVTKATGNPHTLTITEGNNTTVTVIRGTQQLYSGSQIATGDILTISFNTASGYSLSVHTVNGNAFTSGDTITVSTDVAIVSAAVTAGQLAEPSNVSPDVLNGTGCVDVTNGITVSWQVNGNVAMTACRIVICENDTESTQVYSTGKYNLVTPFWGHDFEGNVVYWNYTILPSVLASAGVINGKEYKLIITQWWGESSSITQNTASVFVTRAAPTVSVTFGGSLATVQTFIGDYSQENGTPLNWVRWTIYQGAEVGTPEYDSGRISGTGVLRVDWDGMMPDVEYMVVCEVETAEGDRASGSLLHTISLGNEYVFSGGVTACQLAESGIKVSWTPQPYVDMYTIHRRAVGETRFVKIADVNGTTVSIIDYSAAAQTPYVYYVFPIINSTHMAQEPGISDEVTADFRVWSIIRTSQSDKQSFSMTKRYAFRIGFGGVNQSGYSNNNNPSLLQNFTRYPVRQVASSNYLSGSVSGFIGEIGSAKTYSDTISQAREIMALSQTTDPLFLCDTKGNFIRIQTAGDINVSVHTSSRIQPQTLTIPWAEIGDASGVSVLDRSKMVTAFAIVSKHPIENAMRTNFVPIIPGQELRIFTKTNGDYSGGAMNKVSAAFWDKNQTSVVKTVEVSGDLNQGITVNTIVPANAGYLRFLWYIGSGTTISVIDSEYV